MEEPTLDREPNPEPNPKRAAGAIPKPMRIKIAVASVVLMMALMGSCFLLSRKNTPVRQRPVQVLADPSRERRNAPEDRAAQEAYEKARHDLEALRRQAELDRLNRQTYPPYQPPMVPSNAATPQVQETPHQTAKQEYEELLRKAAYSDNMVEVKKNARTSMADSRSGGLNNSLVTNPDRNADDAAVGAPRLIPATALPEGTVIECTLVNQLTGDNSGPVQVQVSNDTFLPGTRTIVIPQGSRFIGDSKQVSMQNQQRLAVAFHRLLVGTVAGHIYPYSLDQMPAMDETGAMALKDKVNNHYAQIFGASLAIGAIGGLAQIGNGGYGGLNGYDSSVEFRNGITQSMAQSSSQILNRFLNRLPTITIRPGTRVDVWLTKDLVLPPYEAQ